MLKYDKDTKTIRGRVKSLDKQNWLDVNATWPQRATKEHLHSLQIAIYVMCGGGMLGKVAATQPGIFTIDTKRRLPYSQECIRRVTTCLIAVADCLGEDPCNLDMPPLPSCWVW